MAKIYETPVDLARDELAERAQNARHAASNELNSALIGGLIATGSHTTEELYKLESSLAKSQPSSFFSGFNKVMMWVGIITGVMGLIGWFNKRNEATRAEAQLQVLGGEEVKYPAATLGMAVDTPAEGKYCDRLKQEVATGPARPL